MAEFFEALTDKHISFIEKQPMFFVATACAEGRINLSPKGYDSFRVLGPNLCGYMDLLGSGNETSTHIKHDGRMTIMFNSFDRNALIMRLYGRGRVVRPHHPEWDGLVPEFPTEVGTRQFILLDVETVQTSCGYAVPVMEMVEDRKTMRSYIEKKGDAGVKAYIDEKNRVSIDGLDTGLMD